MQSGTDAPSARCMPRVSITRDVLGVSVAAWASESRPFADECAHFVQPRSATSWSSPSPCPRPLGRRAATALFWGQAYDECRAVRAAPPPRRIRRLRHFAVGSGRGPQGSGVSDSRVVWRSSAQMVGAHGPPSASARVGWRPGRFAWAGYVAWMAELEATASGERVTGAIINLWHTRSSGSCSTSARLRRASISSPFRFSL